MESVMSETAAKAAIRTGLVVRSHNNSRNKSHYKWNESWKLMSTLRPCSD